DLMGGWEPVFHAVLVGDFIYVPGVHGTVWKLNTDDGSVAAHINPGYPAVAGATVYVAGPLLADNNGNVYFHALQLDYYPVTTAGSELAVGSWLVKIAPNDSAAKASFATLVPGAPPPTGHFCRRAFTNNQLPWPGNAPDLGTPTDPTTPY